MCGENAEVYNAIIDHQGSPPHVRGKPQVELAILDDVGITPACAGKT